MGFKNEYVHLYLQCIGRIDFPFCMLVDVVMGSELIHGAMLVLAHLTTSDEDLSQTLICRTPPNMLYLDSRGE